MYTVKNIFFENLERNMPDVFSRQEASRLIGNIISSNTLRNLDSKDKGSRVKTIIGKKVCYEKRSFIDWLKAYTDFTTHLRKNIYESKMNDDHKWSQHLHSGFNHLRQTLFPE
jgi:hypothetical protein